MPEVPVIGARLETYRGRAEAALAMLFDGELVGRADSRLREAMRYSLLAGGKRLRPVLLYAAATAVGGSRASAQDTDRAACAIECIHTYSLIHDDLPAMDNDDLRRGQPTCHKAFDEATAILAGDALQTLAFELLAAAPQPAERRVAMLAELARAAGVAGMCGGQALDIDATGKGGQSGFPLVESHSDPLFPLAELERLHALKTGALLRCAVRLGALAGNATPAQAALLDRYADALGLAFQIRDDLLDIEGDAATLGKTAGKDVAQAKATFPALLGIEASRTRLAALAATMRQALDALDVDTGALHALARQVVERSH